MVFKRSAKSTNPLSVWEWCKNVWYSNKERHYTVMRVVWEWCKNVWYSNKPKITSMQISVWEWCKNVWYSNWPSAWITIGRFENDVKMYGIQTIANEETSPTLFENDVKMYGIQTKYILMTQNTSLRMM